MRTIAVISQKGGAGKTTVAVHLAVAAAAHGKVSLVIDTDPQATASRWGEWREGRDPEVIDCGAPSLLGGKLAKAAELGAELVVIDTPPHADATARQAARHADLILVPCRPKAFDLAAIETTADLGRCGERSAAPQVEAAEEALKSVLRHLRRCDRAAERLNEWLVHLPRPKDKCLRSSACKAGDTPDQ